MDIEQARAFISDNHRAVLVTKRKDGHPQTSPIAVGVDDAGYAVISSRETAYKVRNLRRVPYATLCVINDGFFGEWVQIEGPATIVSLPDAMEGLVDYYRRLAGEHPDWDDYRAAMERDKRVLIKVAIERVGPNVQG